MAFLTGINRVAEYRNHWSDVIAGFLVGISIAAFLVSTAARDSFYDYEFDYEWVPHMIYSSECRRHA